MTRNSKILLAIGLASVLMFVYVVPGAVNRATGALNGIMPSWAGTISPIPERSFVLGLDLLGGAHLLYEADFSGLGPEVDRSAAMQGVRDVVERRVNFFGVSEPVVQLSGTNRLIVEIAGVKDVNEAIKLIGETPFLEFKEPDGTYVMPEEPTDLDLLAGWKSTGLTGKQLRSASVVFDPQTRKPQVSLTLNDDGAKLFADITRRNLGKPVAIFLDGVPISVPTVQSEITDGNAVITGNFTANEAKLLATRLNSGALPVPITLISQQRVGATLGEESLAASMTAGLWSLLFVALFMVALYRLPGAVSIVALAVYTLGVLTIYKLLPVTLTLAGIAGFILSLGIGVDANVLIFARMREELKAGKPLMAAMVEGFRRSWPSIRDSHMTTFIGALVLYLFTTSIVKGFALTLGIGVILSLVTSTVVTRAFLTALMPTSLSRWRWLFA